MERREHTTGVRMQPINIEICQELVKKLVVEITQFIIRKGLCFPVHMMTVGAAPKLHMEKIRLSPKHYYRDFIRLFW